MIRLKTAASVCVVCELVDQQMYIIHVADEQQSSIFIKNQFFPERHIRLLHTNNVAHYLLSQ